MAIGEIRRNSSTNRHPTASYCLNDGNDAARFGPPNLLSGGHELITGFQVHAQVEAIRSSSASASAKARSLLRISRLIKSQLRALLRQRNRAVASDRNRASRLERLIVLNRDLLADVRTEATGLLQAIQPKRAA